MLTRARVLQLDYIKEGRSCDNDGYHPEITTQAKAIV